MKIQISYEEFQGNDKYNLYDQFKFAVGTRILKDIRAKISNVLERELYNQLNSLFLMQLFEDFSYKLKKKGNRNEKIK